MSWFSKKVNRRSRSAMTNFLRSHFRYHTMNSWNCATSYANNIKVHCLDLPKDVQENMFEIVDEGSFYDECSWVLHDFNARYDYRYRIGGNGRSGGYLVLRTGGRKETEHKSRCRKCGQLNFTVVGESGGVKEPFGTCGRCGEPARVNLKNPIFETYTTGRGLDEDNDFAVDGDPNWDMDSLRDRVDLVQRFDAACDMYVDVFCDFCRGHRVEDGTVMVEQRVKLLVPV